MPILYGDRLVGTLDAATDHRAGVLRINAIHEDVEFTMTMMAAIDRDRPRDPRPGAAVAAGDRGWTIR